MKMIKMIVNPASIRNEAQPVLNLYYNQAQSSQPLLINLVLQSARLPLVSQKSRFRNLLDFPWSVKNLDSGWGTANPETCPIAFGHPKNLDSCLGNGLNTPGNRAHGHSCGGI